MSEYDDWKQENDRWEAYLYPNGVLRNKLGITKAAKWHKMERGFVAARNADFQPSTGLTTGSVGEELFAVHQYLFQDCYEWAGQPRNVWMFKGHTTFAGPDDIIPMLEEVNADIAEFDWDNNDIDADDLKHYINAAQLGEIHARLNLIHPFREGNGRATRIAMSRLAYDHGIKLNVSKIEDGYRDFVAISEMTITDHGLDPWPMQALYMNITTPLDATPQSPQSPLSIINEDTQQPTPRTRNRPRMARGLIQPDNTHLIRNPHNNHPTPETQPTTSQPDFITNPNPEPEL